MQRNLVIEQVKRDEGLRLTAYRDTVGVLTIGYGHNCAAYPVAGVKKVGDRIDQNLADELLKIDLLRAQRELCRSFPWVETWMSPIRYAVLINMSFNLGISRLKGFKKMWAAIRDRNFKTAAKEMLDSKWALQVGKRAQRLAYQMEHDEWKIAPLGGGLKRL